MIAMLLAAQLSAVAVHAAPAAVAAPRLAVIGENSEVVRMHRFRQPKFCSAASQLQTSFVTPTLLYREQDRARTHFSKLKDLPPAEACLVGAQEEEK